MSRYIYIHTYAYAYLYAVRKLGHMCAGLGGSCVSVSLGVGVVK